MDDVRFIGINPLVSEPGWDSTARFFREISSPSTVGGYYIPITMTSLMLDYAAGGRPDDLRVFHRTNLLLHLCSVSLLFLILARLFGVLPAGVAALLFGLHPLTVEPVAWVSERKTLLATLFAFASIWTYLLARMRTNRWIGVSVGFYLLALLSKPTVILLPFVLLLLDAWPLRRMDRRAWLGKIPYFALAAASVVVTLISQKNTVGMGIPGATDLLRSPLQIGRLLVFYLEKIVWPVGLSCVYPDPGPFTLSNPWAVGSALLVLVLTLGLAMAWRRHRGPLVVWAIFVLSILPTLGLLEYSWIVVSDKYVYFPAFGLVLGIGSALAVLLPRVRHRTPILVAVFVALGTVLAGEVYGVRRTLEHWTDTLTLYRYMEATAPESAVVQGKLGFLLYERGEVMEALPHLERAAQLAPADCEAAYWYGVGLCVAGQPAQGAEEFRRALSIDPTYKEASNQLGNALVMLGRSEDAARQFRLSLGMDPTDAGAHLGLAVALLDAEGNEREAAENLRAAVAARPDWVEALNRLAWLLATSADASVRDGAEGLRLAGRAVRLTGAVDPNVLDTQAAAQAAAGQYERAVETAREALRLALGAEAQSLADEIRARLSLYERGEAYRAPDGR